MKKVEFDVGKLVVLISGGPLMTIEKITNYDDKPIQCVWFDKDDNLKRAQFLPDVLTVITEPITISHFTGCANGNVT